MNEQAWQGEVCECCGHDPADCICPECPVCSERGNKNCYIVSKPLNIFSNKHGRSGLEYNLEQYIGQVKLGITRLKVQHQRELDDEQQTLNDLVAQRNTLTEK